MKAQKNVRTRQQPAAKGTQARSQPAKIQGGLDRKRVSKREYLSDVVTTLESIGEFGKVAEFVINAATGTTFPWLSGLAALYESYKFLKLRFEFHTSSPTTQPGYVAIVPLYDPEGDDPEDKVHAMDYADAIRCPVWDDMNCSLSSQGLSKRKTYFTRPLGQDLSGADFDLGLYDTGRLLVYAGGLSDLTEGASVGELWVDYEVELMTPILPNNNVCKTIYGEMFRSTAITPVTQWSESIDQYRLNVIPFFPEPPTDLTSINISIVPGYRPFEPNEVALISNGYSGTWLTDSMRIYLPRGVWFVQLNRNHYVGFSDSTVTAPRIEDIHSILGNTVGSAPLQLNNTSYIDIWNEPDDPLSDNLDHFYTPGGMHLHGYSDGNESSYLEFLNDVSWIMSDGSGEGTWVNSVGGEESQFQILVVRDNDAEEFISRLRQMLSHRYCKCPPQKLIEMVKNPNQEFALALSRLTRDKRMERVLQRFNRKFESASPVEERKPSPDFVKPGPASHRSDEGVGGSGIVSDRRRPRDVGVLKSTRRK